MPSEKPSSVATGFAPLPTTASSIAVPPLPNQSLQPAAPLPESGGSSGKPAPTYNPLPEPAIFSSETPSVFTPLESQPKMVVIINSCTYDLYLDSTGCDTGVKGQRIAAGDTYTEPIRGCTNAGVALHVTSKSHTRPVMVEYGAGKTGQVFYDLSFLDCMVQGTTNLTGCAGWEQGHQCQGGKDSTVMACLPGEYCDRTSYTVPEFGQTPENKDSRGKVPAPVASTELAEGLIWEICAANRQAPGSN